MSGDNTNDTHQPTAHAGIMSEPLNPFEEVEHLPSQPKVTRERKPAPDLDKGAGQTSQGAQLGNPFGDEEGEQFDETNPFSDSVEVKPFEKVTSHGDSSGKQYFTPEHVSSHKNSGLFESHSNHVETTATQASQRKSELPVSQSVTVQKMVLSEDAETMKNRSALARLETSGSQTEVEKEAQSDHKPSKKSSKDLRRSQGSKQVDIQR